MSDLVWSALSLLLLAAGIGGCMIAHRLGLASTHARDLLHIGTGVWVLGWPLWQSRAAPLVIVGLAALATLAVPLLAKRASAAAKLHQTFASGDERWTGLVLYTIAYAIFTALGLFWAAFPAAAALLSLSLGDGIGGAVGRRFGRHPFALPGGKGKTKSYEGSAAVAVAAGVGVVIAAWRFDVSAALPTVAGLGLSAAVAEAFSPRGTDNLIVPAAVWALAEMFAS